MRQSVYGFLVSSSQVSRPTLRPDSVILDTQHGHCSRLRPQETWEEAKSTGGRKPRTRDPRGRSALVPRLCVAAGNMTSLLSPGSHIGCSGAPTEDCPLALPAPEAIPRPSQVRMKRSSCVSALGTRVSFPGQVLRREGCTTGSSLPTRGRASAR